MNAFMIVGACSYPSCFSLFIILSDFLWWRRLTYRFLCRWENLTTVPTSFSWCFMTGMGYTNTVYFSNSSRMDCRYRIFVQNNSLWFFPISSISNLTRNGKHSGLKCAEHNAEHSDGDSQSRRFTFTKLFHCLRRAGFFGNLWRENPSVWVFLKFPATHLVPLPLLFPPISPRGIFRDRINEMPLKLRTSLCQHSVADKQFWICRHAPDNFRLSTIDSAYR
jgi:hypothetical protein